MKNCYNCKHKLSRYTGLMTGNQRLTGYLFVAKSNSVCEDFYVKCANGKTEACQKWWIDNIKKPLNETSEMTCFKPTEGSVILDNMMDLLDEMSNKLKNK